MAQSNPVTFRPGTFTPIDHGRIDRLAQRDRAGGFHRYAIVHDQGSSIVRFPEIQDDLGYAGGLPGFDEDLTEREQVMGGRKKKRCATNRKKVKVRAHSRCYKKKKLKGKGHCYAGN